MQETCLFAKGLRAAKLAQIYRGLEITAKKHQIHMQTKKIFNLKALRLNI